MADPVDLTLVPAVVAPVPGSRADDSPGPPAAADNGELVGASVVTLSASVTTVVLGLLRGKLIAVLLGPAGVGVVANLGLYTTLASMVGTTFAGQGVTRAIAEARARDDQHRVDWLIRYGFIVPAVVGVAVMLATMALAAPIAGLILGDPGAAPLVALASLAIPLGVLTASWSVVLHGFLRIGALARVGIATSVVSLVVTVGLVAALGLVGAAMAGAVIAATQVLILARREPWVVRARAWRRPLDATWPAIRPVLIVSATAVALLAGNTVVGLLIRADMVRVLGTEQNGIYQPVAAISDLYLETVLASVGFYLLPKLTTLLGEGRRSEAAGELAHGLRIMLSITVPLLLAAVALGEPLIRLLYSDSFAAGADPLAVQSVGSVFKVISWGIGAALVPLGYYRAWLGIGFTVLAVRYVVARLLMPEMGLIGVAMAYDLAWVLGCSAEVFVVVALGRLVPRSRDWSMALAAVGLVAVTLAARGLGDGAAIGVGAAAVVAWVAIARSELAALVLAATAIARPQFARLSGRPGGS